MNSMDETAQALSHDVATKVRPQYQRWLKRGKEPAQAYSLAYEKVVELVTKAQNTSPEKARFAARDVLQAAMDVVTH